LGQTLYCGDVRTVWRYQRGNQKLSSEGETIQCTKRSRTTIDL